MNKVYESYIEEYKQNLKNTSYFYAKDTLLNRLYGFEDRGEFTIEVLDELLELKKQKDDVVEYIKNNPLFKEEYDYDNEDNLYLSGISDEEATNYLLRMLGEIDE